MEACWAYINMERLVISWQTPVYYITGKFTLEIASAFNEICRIQIIVFPLKLLVTILELIVTNYR